MNTGNAETLIQGTPENIIQLDPRRRAKQASVAKSRFRILPFTNRAGSQSWRVTGIKRDGTRIRENYADQQSAQCRQIDLEAEFHARQSTDTGLRATKLTDTQVKIAEVAFVRLDSDEEMLSAVEYWLRHGRQQSVQQTVKLDEAIEQFTSWLEAQGPQDMRDATRHNLRKRVNLFANATPNHEVASITSDTVVKFLDSRNVSRRTKINDRLALSRFFSWCREKPRQWLAVNPAAKEGKSKRQPTPQPEILSLEECERLLRTAEKFKDGKLAPYVAVCLFEGLRPTEATLIRPDQFNLVDRELRIEADQTKTHRPRVVAISKTLAAWLKAYGCNCHPANFTKDWRALRIAAGFGTPSEERPDLKPWVEDIMRHTSISHYFRSCGSYGLTAEWAGNSEKIIKDHYKGRVSTEDTKRFYALLPKKGGRK